MQAAIGIKDASPKLIYSCLSVFICGSFFSIGEAGPMAEFEDKLSRRGGATEAGEEFDRFGFAEESGDHVLIARHVAA